MPGNGEIVKDKAVLTSFGVNLTFIDEIKE